MIKRTIAFVEKSIDLAGGLLGGVVFATLCSAFTYFLIKEIEQPIRYALLSCLLFYTLFPILGLLRSTFFILYFAPVASGLGSEDGMEAPEDDGHSWKATILMILYILSSITLLIGALFQIGIIVYGSVLGIAIYSFLAPKIYQTEMIKPSDEIDCANR